MEKRIKINSILAGTIRLANTFYHSTKELFPHKTSEGIN